MILLNNYYFNQLDKEIPSLKNKYNKILFLKESQNGNTLRKYSNENDIAYINVNLYLSEKLIDVETNRRTLKAISLMSLLGERENDIICLDYFEMLFEPSLKLKPFEIFKDLSKRKVVVIAWRYEVNDGYLIYARPGHPEFKKELVTDMTIIH